MIDMLRIIWLPVALAGWWLFFFLRIGFNQRIPVKRAARKAIGGVIQSFLFFFFLGALFMGLPPPYKKIVALILNGGYTLIPYVGAAVTLYQHRNARLGP